MLHQRMSLKLSIEGDNLIDQDLQVHGRWGLEIRKGQAGQAKNICIYL